MYMYKFVYIWIYIQSNNFTFTNLKNNSILIISFLTSPINGTNKIATSRKEKEHFHFLFKIFSFQEILLYKKFPTRVSNLLLQTFRTLFDKIDRMYL